MNPGMKPPSLPGDKAEPDARETWERQAQWDLTLTQQQVARESAATFALNSVGMTLVTAHLVGLVALIVSLVR